MTAGIAQSKGMPADGRIWFIFYAMLVGQFLAMLDVQIVAASVNEIRDSVSASNDEISWVQTSYLMSEIVSIPLAAYWSKRWGTLRVYTLSCLGFVAASVLTAGADSLEFLVLSRSLQGFFGGAMLPTVFSFAFSAVAEGRRARASLMLSLAATLAPTLGPAAGGYITELSSWRWLFLLNVPLGLASVAIVHLLGRRDAAAGRPSGRFDWVGLVLLSLLLVALLYVLEEGPAEDWLQSDSIVYGLFVCAAATTLLAYHLSVRRDAILDLRPMANRNFALGIVIVLAAGLALFGGTFILPLFLSEVLDYTPGQIGRIVFVSGLAMLLTGLVVGRFLDRLDPRLPMSLGFALAAFGLWIGGAVTEQWSSADFTFLQIARGVGVMLAVTVVQTSMMATLPPDVVPGASALVYLARNLGGAAGLASLSSLLDHWTMVHLAELSARIGTRETQTAAGLEELERRLSAAAPGTSGEAAGRLFHEAVRERAMVLAFQECFLYLAIGALVAAGVALLMSARRKAAVRRDAAPAAAAPDPPHPEFGA
jgi:DHA2 family multidrug resistance protein